MIKIGKYDKVVGDVLISEKEIKIIKLVSNNLMSKEIAPFFNTTAGSIDDTRHRMVQFLGCNSMVGVVRWAIDNGLIDTYSTSTKPRNSGNREDHVYIN